MKFFYILFIGIGLILSTQKGIAQTNFTAGNIVVLDIGNGSSSATGTTNANLIEYTQSGSLIQTVAVPTETGVINAGNGVTFSSTATSDGDLNLSVNGKLLTFGGYDAPTTTTGLVSSSANKMIGEITNAAVISFPSSFHGLKPTIGTNTCIYYQNNFRSVSTVDGTGFWTGGSFTTSGTQSLGGIYYIPSGTKNAISTTTGVNFLGASGFVDARNTKIFLNQLYGVDKGTSDPSPFTIGSSGTPPTSGTYTYNVLNGLPTTTGDVFGYVLFDRDGDGNPDLLYIADNTSGLRKYYLSGTTWTAAGVIAGSFYGITGYLDCNYDPVLFITTNVANTSANQNTSLLYTYSDATTSSTSLSGTMGSAGVGTMLANAGPYNYFRGVAFVPTQGDQTTATSTLSGQYRSITLTSGTTTLTGPVNFSDSFYVGSGATLDCGNNIITGKKFFLSPGATLKIGSANGIAMSSNSGNVQTSCRAFSSSANYVYEGFVAQVTGDGLPSVVNDLTIANTALSGGVTPTSSVLVNDSLILSRGSFINGSSLSLNNNATIVRTSGSLNSAPTFSTSVNVIYNYYTSPIITGNELPLSTTILNNLTSNSSNGVILNANTTSNGTLALDSGAFNINGDSLSINNTTTIIGTLSGSYGSNLTINGAANTLNFTSTADTLKNLLLNTGASMTIASSTPLFIAAGVAPGNVTTNNGAVLMTNGMLTLCSDVNGTSSVGTSTGTISGNVTVDRYFPSHRSWRLVTAPISNSGAPTINASWQEGYSNVSRLAPVYSHNSDSIYGTIITKSTSETSNGIGGTTDGFDQGSTNNPSILFFNSSHIWGLATTATNTGAITDEPGYMLFARGGRDYYVAGTNVPPTSTTLRVKGLLNQGTQSLNGNGLTVLGNPYASTIYYDSLYIRSTHVGGGPGMASYYYIWDPFMTGSNSVGSFVLVSKLSGFHSYILSPDPRSTDSLNTPHAVDTTGAIQSGQAIIVNYAPSGTNSSSIQETDKGPLSDNYSFRPETPASSLGDDSTQEFRANLFAVNSDNTTSLEDGVLNLYNNSYTDSVNFLEDAPKLGNFAETIALLRDGHYLALESRKIIGITDTIFYSLFGMKQKPYVLEFIASDGMNHPGLSGFLVDSFLHTLTPVNLNGTTDINFTVTADPASSATNRFTVIFIPALGSPLPVTFTSVKATQQNNKNIAVQWNVENQLNIKQYEVEKSIDGANFTVVDTTAAIGNDISSINYNWVDGNVVPGDNYYRIMSMGNNGLSSYSQVVVVKVTAGTQPTIAVYPNPVKNGIINLQFTNMPQGDYNVRLFNTVGQKLLTKTITYKKGTGIQTIPVNNYFMKGIYRLEIIKPDNSVTEINVCN